MSVITKVKMYNQENLGDCFLIQFINGRKRSWVMIDFGSYKGKNEVREKEIAKHIVSVVKKDPVYVVLTHQHKDHLSGFLTAADILKQLKAPELWLSFLDDDTSEAGKAVKSVSTKYWQKSKKINTLVRKKFAKHPPVQNMLKAKEGYDLFAEEQTGGEAIKKLTEWTDDIKFLTPGQNFDMPGMEGEVKVYVLGPPTDFNMLKSMNPKKGEDVDGLTALNEIDTTSDFLLGAIETLDNNNALPDNGFPFSKKFILPNEDSNVRSIYNEPDQGWRKIDTDWLGDIGRLALYMDTLTNNTSLVLAFEIVTTKKVLLFVGDAQIGNWKSWFDVQFEGTKTTAKDLLTRTVLYKAGHHSSHNATLREGLDLMNEKELVIMVPLNQKISDSYHFQMGKPPMMQGYNRMSHGRMVRTDTIFQKDINQKNFQYAFAKKAADISGLAIEASKPQLYIEYTVK